MVGDSCGIRSARRCDVIMYFTKVQQMCTESNGQAGEQDKGVTQIEVTPEMIGPRAIDVGLGLLLSAGADNIMAADYADAVVASVSEMVRLGQIAVLCEPEIHHSGSSGIAQHGGSIRLVELVEARRLASFPK